MNAMDLETKIKNLREARRLALSAGDRDAAQKIFRDLQESAREYANMSMAGLELCYNAPIEEKLIRVCHECGLPLDFMTVLYGDVSVRQAGCCGVVYAE